MDLAGNAGTECRPSAALCDVAESCDGSSPTCPADSFAAAGTLCRAATGPCDVAETCTGSAITCPADGFQPDDTPCDDGNACTTPDTCQAGICTGVADADSCADDYLCYRVKPSAFAPVPTVNLVSSRRRTSPPGR